MPSRRLPPPRPRPPAISGMPVPRKTRTGKRTTDGLDAERTSKRRNARKRNGRTDAGRSRVRARREFGPNCPWSGSSPPPPPPRPCPRREKNRSSSSTRQRPIALGHGRDGVLVDLRDRCNPAPPIHPRKNQRISRRPPMHKSTQVYEIKTNSVTRFLVNNESWTGTVPATPESEKRRCI